MDMDMTTPPPTLPALTPEQTTSDEQLIFTPQPQPFDFQQVQQAPSPFIVEQYLVHSHIAANVPPSPDLSTPTHALQPNNLRSTTDEGPPSSQGSTLKKRFTMGPRTDCDKCRLGVKGHYMHFD